MVSKVESGFLAKLDKARGLVSMCSEFYNFNPPGLEENPEAMNKIIGRLHDSYISEMGLIDQYQDAVDIRLKAYKFEENSIEELCVPISNTSQAFLGKDSSGFKTINNFIKKIRASKLVKVTIDPNQSDSQNAISNAEKTFEAMLELFAGLVNTLAQFSIYKPSRNDLKVENLKAFIDKVSGLNKSVVSSYNDLSSTRTKRKILYEELKSRIQKIKSYVKSNYGITSDEYNMIKGIRV